MLFYCSVPSHKMTRGCVAYNRDVALPCGEVSVAFLVLVSLIGSTKWSV